MIEVPALRRLLGVGLAVLAALAFVAPGAEAAATATITPGTAFDFGSRNILSGPSTTRTYTVTSTGTDPLVIGQAAVTGTNVSQFALGADNCSQKTINPADTVKTCTVQIVFNPTATGAKSATLTIPTNGPTLVSPVNSGFGRNLKASAGQLSYAGRVGAGAGAAQTVTFTNHDSAAFTFAPAGATIAGSNASQFAESADTCAAKVLDGGDSCQVSVTFAATAPGRKNANLAIASFGPVLVTLAGDAEQPAASIAPATRVFDDRALDGGASPAQDFLLTNTGSGALTVGAAELTGADDGEFHIAADACSGKSLAVGAECKVSVTFDPATAGYRRASLRVPTNVAGPAVVARLEGRGKGSGNDTVFDTPIDLAFQPIVRLQGDGGDSAASLMSGSGCDLDDDGYDDIVIGAPLWSRRPADLTWEGGAYIHFGGPAVGGGDLAAGGDSIFIEGWGEGSQTGAVGCADANGDGIDDLLIGGWAYEYPGRPTGTGAARGTAYVVFGSTDLRERVPADLGHLGEQGFRIVGGDAFDFDHLGIGMSGLGDLDGDGKDEIGVLANTSDTTDTTPVRTNNGNVYVVKGQAGTDTVDLGQPGVPLLRIVGASPGSAVAPFGQMNALAGLGDVNGDGTPDIGIGTYTATSLGRATASGAGFAVSGAKRGRADLADPDAYLFAAGGAFAGHRLGISIAAAGDVNGDDIDDMLVGADSTAAANSDAAYVVYGSETRPAENNGVLDTLALGNRGFRIRGGGGTSSGFAIAGIGDVNGDGLDDLAVGGGSQDGVAGSQAGAGWIVYGVADPATLPVDTGLVPANASDSTRVIALSGLTLAEGSRTEGQTAGERLGRSVSAVGDVDGNGTRDVAFASDGAFRLGRTGAGEVAVALLPGPARDAAIDPQVNPPVDPPGKPGVPGKPIVPPARLDVKPGLRSAARPLRLDRRGRLTLTVHCPGANVRCVGTLRVKIGGRRTAPVGFVIPEGKSKRVRVALSGRVRRLLARHRSLAAVVSFRVKEVGVAGVVSASKRITVKPAVSD